MAGACTMGGACTLWVRKPSQANHLGDKGTNSKIYMGLKLNSFGSGHSPGTDSCIQSNKPINFHKKSGNFLNTWAITMTCHRLPSWSYWVQNLFQTSINYKNYFLLSQAIQRYYMTNEWTQRNNRMLTDDINQAVFSVHTCQRGNIPDTVALLCDTDNLVK